MKKITVGITDCSKWTNYANWFLQRKDVGQICNLSYKNRQIINLSYRENNFSDIDKCDGIVLSGGEDVHPKFYNKPKYISILKPEEIKIERDEFELKVIEKALKQKKPILGICRGLQIANVFFGGTLIPDIPSAGKPSHSKVKGYDKRHTVNIFDESILKKIIGKGRGEINSAHHQAADVVAKDLRVTAVADDGIIEGLEWQNPFEKSFLLLVQWHPERMADAQSPFAKNIRDKFLTELKK